jgi:molybdopterin-guanine dinucleotide biosynthesis protein A
VYIITKTPEMFSFQAKIIKEQIDIYAPTAGFVTMFSALEDECFFVLGIDLPFVDEDVIKKLFNEDHSGLDVTVATTSNFTEAMCGIYHRSAASKFYEMLDNDVHKLKRSLEELKTKKVFFHEDWKFCNLNTPQEYQKALKLYGIISQKEKI